MSRRYKPRSLILIFVFLSILAHLIFVLFITNFPFSSQEQIPEKPKAVFVELAKQSKPIVDIPKPKVEEVPQKATAESLYNQKVKEEQVSSKSGPTILIESPPKKAVENVNKTPGKKMNDEKPKTEPKKTNPVAKYDSIPGMPEMKPSQLSGDYVEKIKIGSVTYINAQANPRLAYIVELKRRFYLTWNPIPLLRAQMGRLPPGNIQTKIGFTVSSNGTLLKAIVLSPSLVEGYDQEALRTIQSSAPFSSPPAYLLENGVVNIYWGFIVPR